MALLSSLGEWVQAGKKAPNISRRFTGGHYAAAMAGAAVVGAGSAIASHHPLRGAIDNAMDIAFYDPMQEDQGIRGRDYDNMILGRDIQFGEIFPIPFNPKSQNLPFLPFNSYQLSSINPEGFKNASAAQKNEGKMKSFISGQLAAARRDINDTGYTDSDPWVAERYGYADKYRPSAYRGPNVSGDIVFGLNNMR